VRYGASKIPLGNIVKTRFALWTYTHVVTSQMLYYCLAAGALALSLAVAL
jgi:hypothetical protein